MVDPDSYLTYFAPIFVIPFESFEISESKESIFMVEAPIVAIPTISELWSKPDAFLDFWEDPGIVVLPAKEELQYEKFEKGVILVVSSIFLSFAELLPDFPLLFDDYPLIFSTLGVFSPS
jgi:hypothetical protein